MTLSEHKAVLHFGSHYYRFLGAHGVIAPDLPGATPVEYQTVKYWALEA